MVSHQPEARLDWQLDVVVIADKKTQPLATSTASTSKTNQVRSVQAEFVVVSELGLSCDKLFY